jgi:O-methyltransferase involved in polyketide biosynthesis
MYLTEAAIDASLRAIRAWSAPGSQLAMTYFSRERIDAPSLRARLSAALVARVGEPWRWGWPHGQLARYLADRGFQLAIDMSLADAATRLLPPELAAHVRQRGRRAALANVSESLAVALASGHTS